jgi:hypothetical protein
MQRPIFTALSDGTHIHYKYDGTETYCSEKHPKKLSQSVKIAIISGWFTALILAAHLILNSQGL